MDERPIVIPVYKRVWKVERYLYRIDRFKLLRPVTYWQIGYFFISVIAMYLLSKYVGIFNFVPVLVRYIVIPIGLAYYLSKARHDGKAPHRWIYGYARYLLSPRYYNRYRRITKKKRHRYSGHTTFREIYNIEKGVR